MFPFYPQYVLKTGLISNWTKISKKLQWLKAHFSPRLPQFLPSICTEFWNSGNIIIFFAVSKVCYKCHNIQKSCCSAVEQRGAKQHSSYSHSTTASTLVSWKQCTSGGSVLSCRTETSCFNIKEQVILCMT